MQLTGKIMITMASVLLMALGCQTVKNTNHAQRGVAVGTTTGAVIGAVLGNNVGNKNHTVIGAIIGAAVGGAIGGVIGTKMDRQAEKIKNEVPGAVVERVGEGINVTFDENNPDGSKAGVFFDTDQYAITANSKLSLDKLVKIFVLNPETDILIEGHTDDVGTSPYNLRLSKKRAVAVGNFIKADGINPSRLTIKWYGESQPKTDNATDVGKAGNRRVEFGITANQKMKDEATKEANK